MRITKSQLKRIIKEELTQAFSEQHLIEEGWFEKLTGAAVILSMLGLGALQGQGLADSTAALSAAEERVEELQSIDTKIAEIQGTLRSTSAWSWTDGPERATFPTIKIDGRNFYVLPPEWTVYVKVLIDKKNFQSQKQAFEKAEELPFSSVTEVYWKLPPGSSTDSGATHEDIQAFLDDLGSRRNTDSTRQMAKEFMNNLSEEDYDVVELHYLNTPFVMPKWEKLETYGGNLPLMNSSVEETYVSFAFGRSMSREEGETLLSTIPESP
jgi:hypothetical protein